MSIRRYFAVIVALLLVFVSMHTIAVQFVLYWTFPWLDNAMHLFGGFLIGSVAVVGYFLFRKHVPSFQTRFFSRYEAPLAVFLAAAGALLVGLLWEWIELRILGSTQSLSYYAIFGVWSSFDTMVDLFFDAAGGMIAGLAALVFIRE